VIRLGLQALRVQAGRALGWKALIRPFIAHLTLTNRCNLRCSMCNMWAMEPKEDLSEDVLDKLPRSPLWSGIRILDLTGGEPFMADPSGLLQVLITENIKWVYLTTNGVLTQRILEQTRRMLQAGGGGFLLSLGVSLDGPQEIRDRLRGVKGTYGRVMETLSGLSAMARDNSRLQVSIKYTIMPENWEHILQTYHIAQSMGLGFTAKPYLLSGILGNTKEVKFSPEQINGIEAQIREIDEDIIKPLVPRFRVWQSLSRHAGRMFHRELIQYLRRYHLQGDTSGLFPCDSSFISVMIHCDGKIYSCPKLMKPMGDLRQQALESIWGSEQAWAVRRFIQSGACACFSQCDMMPSLLLRRKAWMAVNIIRDWARRR
jgi:radical SAM protein with 4Fe4S-binding SPASM domain